MGMTSGLSDCIIKYDSTYVIVGIDMEKMATKFYVPQYTP